MSLQALGWGQSPGAVLRGGRWETGCETEVCIHVGKSQTKSVVHCDPGSTCCGSAAASPWPRPGRVEAACPPGHAHPPRCHSPAPHSCLLGRHTFQAAAPGPSSQAEGLCWLRGGTPPTWLKPWTLQAPRPSDLAGWGACSSGHVGVGPLFPQTAPACRGSWSWNEDAELGGGLLLPPSSPRRTVNRRQVRRKLLWGRDPLAVPLPPNPALDSTRPVPAASTGTPLPQFP